MAVGVVLLIATGVGLGLAGSLGYFDASRHSEASPSATLDQPDLREALDVLRQSLDEQIQRHEELRAEVAQMRAALPGDGSGPSRENLSQERAEAETPRNTDSQEAGTPAGGFDGGALVEAGLNRSDAEWLRGAWERAVFEELALTDAARREGWFQENRFRRERNAIWSDLRSEVGEDAFDALLFATGQLNRVVVTDVITGSAAAYSGFEKGDQILRYAGRRVFNPRELEQRTASGVSGSTVAVEVLRNGRSEILSVRRGPLGLVTGIVRAPPVDG